MMSVAVGLVLKVQEAVGSSVTSFGEISPLWQKLKGLRQFNESLFRIWQKLLPTLAIFLYSWAIFHGCKWTNNENYKSHLVTLVGRYLWVCAQERERDRVSPSVANFIDPIEICPTFHWKARHGTARIRAT